MAPTGGSSDSSLKGAGDLTASVKIALKEGAGAWLGLQQACAIQFQGRRLKK
jgi:hypothetical protein